MMQDTLNAPLQSMEHIEDQYSILSFIFALFWIILLYLLPWAKALAALVTIPHLIYSVLSRFMTLTLSLSSTCRSLFMSAKNWRSSENWQLDPISIERKLDCYNYNHSIWSLKIETILKSRGLWHIVNGTEVAPTEESALERWEMRDACARLQLMVNIQDRCVWIFRQATTANELWTAIQEYYQPESQLKQTLALRRFTSIKPLTEGADIHAHIQYIGALWQDVLATKACASQRLDENALFKSTLLDSLPPSWSGVFTEPDILSMSCSTLVGRILDTVAWNQG